MGSAQIGTYKSFQISQNNWHDSMCKRLNYNLKMNISLCRIQFKILKKQIQAIHMIGSYILH